MVEVGDVAGIEEGLLPGHCKAWRKGCPPGVRTRVERMLAEWSRIEKESDLVERAAGRPDGASMPQVQLPGADAHVGGPGAPAGNHVSSHLEQSLGHASPYSQVPKP